jgi:quercetin dioxygenase-like cupin family protein
MERWRADDVMGGTADGRFRRILVQEERLRSGTLSFAPGDSVPSHAHMSSDEVFLGVSGTGTITVEGEEYEVGPGELMLIHAGERHALHVAQSASEPFVIFAAVAPNSGDDTVFTN